MASPSRDRVTIDLRGIGDAVRAAAACRGMGVAQLVRRSVVMSLDLRATASVSPMKRGSDGQTLEQVPTRETAKLTLRLPQAHADALMLNAAALGLSYGDYVARLVAGSRLPQPVALLKDNGIRCDPQDERFAGEPIQADFVGTLRPDQEQAVAAMLKHDAGVLCAPTAFGKTVTAAAIIARRGVNTLVLVHRTELLKQWQERLQAFLGVGKGVVGTIGGGKAKPTGMIDIAVMQSLSRQGEVNALVESYGQIVVDECHHVGAASFDAILKRAKARFVLGLTATPIRRDGQQPIIFMQCGPIRHTAARPVGAPHDLEVLPRSRFARIDLPTTAGIQDVFRHLANDMARTDAIAAEAAAAFEQGRKVLVLTERTEHLEAIRQALIAQAPAPFVLHGRMSKKQRAALLSEMETLPPEAPRILLATGKLIGEQALERIGETLRQAAARLFVFSTNNSYLRHPNAEAVARVIVALG